MLEPTRDVLMELTNHKLLLKQDKQFPNVVTIVTGETLSTSWWSHPKGRLVFRVLSELSEHPDVLLTKLIFGKDTFIHPSLWPAFLAIASSHEAWQIRGLSAASQSLLSKTDHPGLTVRSSGAPVKELLSRLLVHATEVHTESGKHENVLESWMTWARKVKIKPLTSVTEAQQIVEAACKGIGIPLSGLPWNHKGAKS